MSQAFWGPGRTPVVPAPADPWAGHTHEAPVVADRRARRPIYGFVYELRVRGQQPGTSPYVGKCEGSTPKAVADRVHGSSASAHTSPQSIARDPWKADILPGRDGWRILERIYATADPEADDAKLRRAEADWIDRKKAIHNKVRPVRPFGQQPPPRPRQTPVAVRPPARVSQRELIRQQREAARRRRTHGKLALLLTLAALFTYLTARLVVAMALPWPSVPWVAAPVVGLLLAWAVFEWLLKASRKVTR